VPRLATSFPRDFAISVAKSSSLFSRGPDARSHVRIQWSSRDPDPMAIYFLAPRVLVTLNTQCLGSPPASSRVREILRSPPPVPFRWTLLILSPLRRFAYSHLATFNANFSTLPLTSSRDARCHLSTCQLLWIHTILGVVEISLLAISRLSLPNLGHFPHEVPIGDLVNNPTALTDLDQRCCPS
jgi:hypothetical protein